MRQEIRRRWWAPFRRPRVLAVFSYRYDAHLVPDLIANVSPLVDGWVSFDDRRATEAFSNEPARRTALLRRAQDLGAEWVLCVDPDERFESGLADAMPDLLARASGPRAYRFPMREMFGPETYRVDGVWGRKTQVRLFTLRGLVGYEMDLHSPWLPLAAPHEIVDVPWNLYHLKMMTRARREARRDLYNRLDPDRRYQAIGYDYLADDDGARFETIPPGRGFVPPHDDDGGLWMAEAD